MAEYIDRQAAIEIASGYCHPANIAAELAKLPAADVRPVVFCKDCKRYGGRPWENNESGICARTDCGVGKDDFCSYGEKLEKS